MSNKIRIYNQDKTEVLEYENLDFEAGYVVDREEIIHHEAIEPKEEQGHFQVVAEYANGGQDVKWIVDQEAVAGEDAYDELVQYQIYIPYSQEYMAHKEMRKQYRTLQNKLTQSDHKLFKYLEGYYTDEEYAPIKEQRENYRIAIRNLKTKMSPEDLLEIEMEDGLIN